MFLSKIAISFSKLSPFGGVNKSLHSQLVVNKTFVLASKAEKDVATTLLNELNIKFKENRDKLQNTLAVLAKSFQLFKPTELMLCFNGGKDCTVIMDLLNKYCTKSGIQQTDCFYIRSADPFDEVEAFVQASARNYNLTLHEFEGTQKSALAAAVKDMPQLRAVFMGCRGSDPHCAKLTTVAFTDTDWPPLLRIFPLLEWSYRDVWHYLLQNKVAYCELYDRGYSSLGDKSNTSLNPSLVFFDINTQQFKYRPAHKLADVLTERIARTQDKPATDEGSSDSLA